jgi:calcium permeable stress-gated cation channel
MEEISTDMATQIPDTFVLQHSSIDGYFLLRYLKISVIICFVGCCITWPILFPVNATGHGGQQQLNILSFSNIVNKNRYYAHVFVSWIFIGFVFFMVTRESLYYINTRQAYLLSPLYASRISSRTVLFTSVPTAYADEQKIRRMFGDKLKNVWVARDTKELAKMVDERTKVAMKLEAAETQLIKAANDARLKAVKKGGENDQAASADIEVGADSGSAAGKWITPKQRPTHRLKLLIGQKVDTINWSREEIARLNPLIEKEQHTHRTGEAAPLNAVFVEFFDQTEAQAAYQMVAHHQPLHMAPRVVGFTPGDVVWGNLGITWKTRTIREILTIGAVVVTIIFW